MNKEEKRAKAEQLHRSLKGWYGSITVLCSRMSIGRRSYEYNVFKGIGSEKSLDIILAEQEKLLAEYESGMQF